MGNDDSNTARMAMDFTGDSTQRKWEIKVSQFLCGSVYSPQSGSGCLQYHTGLTGQITSFNFQVSNFKSHFRLGNSYIFLFASQNTQSYHLQNQDYSVCIRQAAGFCCVEYSVSLLHQNWEWVNAMLDIGFYRYVVTLSKTFLSMPHLMVPLKPCKRLKLAANAQLLSLQWVQLEITLQSNVSFQQFLCFKIFLSIIFLASGAQCGETSVSRYCGYKLNPVFDQLENVPVCGKTTKMNVCINLVNDWPFFLDCTAPFAVGVHFDALPETSSAIAGNPARGFCLDYLQIPC